MGFPGEPACSAGDPEETRVGYLRREDPLEEDMATHSSSLAWKMSRTGSLEACSPQAAVQESQRVGRH